MHDLHALTSPFKFSWEGGGAGGQVNVGIILHLYQLVTGRGGGGAGGATPLPGLVGVVRILV